MGHHLTAHAILNEELPERSLAKPDLLKEFFEPRVAAQKFKDKRKAPHVQSASVCTRLDSLSQQVEGFIDLPQFGPFRTDRGWTSLKEIELSSRFFLVFPGAGAFLSRAQPKL